MNKTVNNDSDQIPKNSNICISRLSKDLSKIANSGSDSVYASPDEDNLMNWEAVIFGPESTQWEGGTFKLSLKFTEDYPNKPPQVVFLSKMFHPNIYNDGRICLDILDKNWSPIYDVMSILTSIQSLLSDPNPDSPANAEAAKLYNDNIQDYYKMVKECVENSWEQ